MTLTACRLDRPAWLRAGIAAAAVAVAAVAAQAQGVPGLMRLGPAPAAPAAAASAPTLAEWTSRLEAARAEHRRLLEAVPGSTTLLPERQMASARLVVLLSARVDALRPGRAASASAGAEAAAPAVAELKGPPPFSVLDVDALRDELDRLLAQQATLQRRLKLLENSLQAGIRARGDAEAELRLRREQASAPALRADDAVEREAQLDLAVLMAQVTELLVVQDDDARRQAHEQLSALDAPIARLRAELERAHGQTRFDEAELARIVAGLAAERQRIATESARVAKRLARVETLPAAAGWRDRTAAALKEAIQALSELDSLQRSLELLWRGRQAAIAKQLDARQLNEAASRLDHVLEDLRDLRRRLDEESRQTRYALRAQQERVGSLAAGDPARSGEHEVLEALLALAEVRDRLGDGFDRGVTMIERARTEIGGSERPASTADWLRQAAEVAKSGLLALWQYELFSATESVQLDGRTITVDHGVTVGKSVGVVVMLALGWWLAGRLAGAIVAVLGRRTPLSPHLARVLRRWINSILLLAVVLLVLKMARIPLTAFAFLGGALAIGVGFGAQNVIKNLISGIIILFERKIRVGDVVSIGGMSGTVVTVDLRATTVRGFDGIDAIVPNSTLLENQISNWSGGSPEVRRTIAVGVAYGSDVRQAAQLLLRCAHGSPDVLPQPPAEVLFEDFGADALILRLRYWVRLDSPRAGPVIDSDLRFAIHDALAEAGIAIAFPQRDVHLDVPGALRVELMRTGAGTLGAPAA